MTRYGARAAWRSLGSCCFRYGVFAVIVSLAAGALMGLNVPLTPWEYISNIIVYSSILAIPVLGLMYLENKRRDVREYPLLHEAAVVALVILGFSVPVMGLGLLIIAITIPDYEGVERWLPNIQDRSVYELRSLQEIIAELQLSEEVQESAELMLERARDRGLVKGRSFNEILGAIVYIVARDNHEPRTLDEISDLLRLSNRKLGRAYRYTARELDRDIKPPLPEDYIPWFASKLDLDEEVRNMAVNIIDKATERDIISGKSPTSIAATAIYIAANSVGEPRSMKEVSEALDVTTITLRSRGREMVEELEIENPPGNLVMDEEEQ